MLIKNFILTDNKEPLDESQSQSIAREKAIKKVYNVLENRLSLALIKKIGIKAKMIIKKSKGLVRNVLFHNNSWTHCLLQYLQFEVCTKIGVRTAH